MLYVQPTLRTAVVETSAEKRRRPRRVTRDLDVSARLLDIRYHLGLVIPVLLSLLAPSVRAEPPVTQLSLPLSAAVRLLVVSPHPDDEALGAGGLIQRVVRLGGVVQVVYLTSGDGFPEGVTALWHLHRPQSQDYQAYGALREREARQAMAALGAPSQALRFLGFPDSGLCALQTAYRLDNGQNYRSPFTLADRPRAAAAVLPNTGYNGADLTQALLRVLQQFRPTLLVTTHPRDQHPDHCATYRFVRAAWQAMPSPYPAPRPAFFTFLVHFAGWPLDEAAKATSPLRPPAPFPDPEAAWLALPLTPAERQGKRQALEHYRSQRLVMAAFMRSFVRANELFAPVLQKGLETRVALPCCPLPAPSPIQEAQ